MPDLHTVSLILAAVVLAAPTLLVAVLGGASLAGRPVPERAAAVLSQWAAGAGFTAAAGILTLMLVTGDRDVVLEFGDWVATPGYHLRLKLLFDRLSLPMVLLSFGLCGVIGKFAGKYLHREPGYNRFFVLYALFLLGMVLASVAGTIETLFAGWELVGLSSALLIAFFHDRPAPARNGFRVWVVYRVSDMALVIAAAVLHAETGSGDFDALLGTAPWPAGVATVSRFDALLVGTLLLVAAAGKSALVPFTGWLPRAMEGPTPSSAVFYGALSVHLGAYLLLRVSPLLDAAPVLAGLVVAVGLLTAVFATLASRVQTDIKSALSFASAAQVGLIVAEIGVGWHFIPLVHLIGHACWRTLQFVRAPSLLRDYRQLEDAVGGRLAGGGSTPGRAWLYRLAAERGYLDAMIDDYVVAPFVRAARAADAFDRRMAARIGGTPDPTPRDAPPV